MIVGNNKFKQKCKKHPDFKLEFIQINNLNNNKVGQSIFLCSECADSNGSFNISDYLLIQHIIKQGKEKILTKWPPLNDNKLISSLQQISVEQNDPEYLTDQILSFFNQLKKDIIKEIDLCQKQLLFQIQDIPQKENILSKYQQISNIEELRSIIIENQDNFEENERKCRQFIQNTIQRKDELSQEFQNFLNKSQKSILKFNEQPGIVLRETILSGIRNLNLFESMNYSNSQNDLNNNENKENQENIIQKLENVEFLATTFHNGINATQIKKNNENLSQATIIDYSNWQNIISSIKLEKDKFYKFRIEILLKEGENCMVGIAQDKTSSTWEGYNDYLSLWLEKKNQIIQTKSLSFGLSEHVNCKEFQLSQENIIEVRVCLKDQLLQVLDYPNYKCTLQVKKENKPNLISFEDLRLCLSLHYLQSSMILKEVLIVESFN